MERLLSSIDLKSILGNAVDTTLFFNDNLDSVCNVIFDRLESPPPFNRDKSISFTNDVFLDNKYLNKKVVIKEIPYETQGEKNAVIVEVVIHAVFHKITKGNALCSPEPMRLFKDQKNFYFYQEQIDGVYIHNLKPDKMLDCLLIICDQLDKIQSKYTFTHKDFKSDNLLYSKDKIYVIDFGYSCIGNLKSKKILQSLTEDEAESETEYECINRSADICFLLLSIYGNLGQSPKPDFLRNIVNYISIALNDENCDKLPDGKFFCFQDIVFKYHQLDNFVPRKIYNYLKKYKKKTLKF